MNPEQCKFCSFFDNPDECCAWTCKWFFERDAAKEIREYFQRKKR